MGKIPRVQKEFLKDLKARLCPVCGSRMTPDAGRIGIGNPIVWRCTNPWCVNSLGEDAGRLIGMTHTEFLVSLTPEERAEYDDLYSTTVAGACARLRADLDALVAEIIRSTPLNRLIPGPDKSPEDLATEIRPGTQTRPTGSSSSSSATRTPGRIWSRSWRCSRWRAAWLVIVASLIRRRGRFR